VCDTAFKRNNSLVKHKRMHSADQPFPCDVCGKVFVYQSELVRHGRAHSGERPFSCAICERLLFIGVISRDISGYTLKSGHSLVKCVISHLFEGFICCYIYRYTRVRPFSCNVYSKGFTL
jgi:KRAB domain-containing zinc finger protein